MKTMYRLPVSGANVHLREVTGADDVLLAEAHETDTALALALIHRLAQPAEETVPEWNALTPTDLNVLLLLIRQLTIGEVIKGYSHCPSETCGAQVEISFTATDYLNYQQPKRPRNLEETEESGWFRLDGSPLSFRLPNGADQVAISKLNEPVSELIHRCVRPPHPPARLLQRVERAMEALAPDPAIDLPGTCPECGHNFELRFDPQEFSLREMRDQAAFVYEDVHLIAQHYRWSEAEILQLPRSRRIRYAEMVKEERGYV